MPVINGAADYSDLMLRFRRAYHRADAELLAEVLGDGFEWHNHWFSVDAPNSTGQVLTSLDELIVELERRKEHWTDVWFEGMVEHYSPGLVTQTFTISGKDDGVPFERGAVDLYTVTEDEKIVKKDTYWKYAAG